MSPTRVDLPEPLTPMTAVMTLSGKRTSMFLRLFSQASQTSMYCFQGRLTGSMEIFFLPSRYSKVNDRGQAASRAEASAPEMSVAGGGPQ